MASRWSLAATDHRRGRAGRRLHEYRVEGAERHRPAARGDPRAGTPGRRAARVHARTAAAARCRPAAAYTVGLITTDSSGRFSIPIMLGAEDALSAGEMALVLCDTRDDPLREQHYLRSLVVAAGRRHHRDRPTDRAARADRRTDPGRLRVQPVDRPGRHLGDRRRPRRRGVRRAASARPRPSPDRARHRTATTTAARQTRAAATVERSPAARWSASRCTASGANAGAATPSTSCSASGARRRRDLLRQRPDRPRRLRPPARTRPLRPRRHRRHRLRQLVRDGARQPAAAHHCRPGAGRARPPYGEPPAGRDRRFTPPAA